MAHVPQGSVRSDGGPVLRPQPFGAAYRLGASVRLDHPPSGTTDCAALLLFDADARARTGYAVRLRELTGVPYVGLLRREDGHETLRCTFNLSGDPAPFQPSGRRLLDTGNIEPDTLGSYAAIIEEIA